MYPIYAFGTEEQRLKYLPKLASGEWVGAYGLTEPNHGSDPGSMLTRFEDKGDHYLLNGSKMWITNAPIADVAVVWAKDEEGKVRGIIVEKGMEGFTTPETHGKWSLRASYTGELVFDNVQVPKEHLLPGVKGLKGPLTCLNSARYGIAWGAVGAAMACYDEALNYAKERLQFGKPIASYQIIQEKLVEMLSEITKAQLLVHQLGRLKDSGKAKHYHISLAKRNNVQQALKIARSARTILGAAGITDEYQTIRHLLNLESVLTYEGTHEIHTLILGNNITDLNAFN
jgi:glutaryl-CoA dehydrogenase